MKQWLWAVVGAGVLAVAGCASSGKGGTESIVQVQEDTARRSKTVEFLPQRVACTNVPLCPTLGVRWSSATPNRALLLVGTRGEQAVVESIEFTSRPHGKLRVRSLAAEAYPLPGVTAFMVPMDTLERVAFSKDVTLRLQTSAGSVEENMYTGVESSPAHDALQRLVFEAYKGTDKAKAMGLSGLFGNDKPYQPNYDK